MIIPAIALRVFHCSGWEASFRQLHPAQQVGVARVGTNAVVPERVCFDIHDAARTLGITFLQFSKDLILVCQSRLDHADLIKINISLCGEHQRLVLLR